ncbi:MAG: hypothetical protein ACJ8CR_38135 [Roseiflexaceae bacterium]
MQPNGGGQPIHDSLPAAWKEATAKTLAHSLPAPRRLAGNRAAGLRWLDASPTGPAARHPVAQADPRRAARARLRQAGDWLTWPLPITPSRPTCQCAPVAQATPRQSTRRPDSAPDSDEPTAVRQEAITDTTTQRPTRCETARRQPLTVAKLASRARLAPAAPGGVLATTP